MKSLLSYQRCHSDWHQPLETALNTMDQEYLQQLALNPDWLPGQEKIFNAFTMPLAQTRYILLGESPYPRINSANGFAFWDSDVASLWSDKGLSKPVNRATSLRNLIKMLLLARGELQNDLSQEAIAKMNKAHLIKNAEELFEGMMHKGILLLNACLVYSDGKVPYHARQWKPFMQSMIQQLAEIKPSVQLILLGKIAESVPQNVLPVALIAEHPYNISFITNQRVIDFFKPLDLLAYESY